ncbi:hypothetical protein AAVH_04747 [Aphelenchoides avenae]|nr:hypothetical protein AAVH_04747 [Aphelenchus avenae]
MMTKASFVAILLLSLVCAVHGLRGQLFRSGRSTASRKFHESPYVNYPQGYQEFLRFGRSLYDTQAEKSDLQIRAQRGLQTEAEADIDPDDGQLLRFGR